MPRLAVRDLPVTDRPRYRAQSLGESALSNVELLQLITGAPHMDTCSALITRAGSLTNLARMANSEIAEVNGFGVGNAVAIKAAFELGRRLMLEDESDRAQIRCPADAAHLLMARYSHEEQECFVVMLLDTRNRVIAQVELYRGSLNTAAIRISEVFREPIKRSAAAIIIGHNHPSGDPAPSPEDVQVTKEIVEVGRLMDIEVLDHVVVGKARFVSLKERGLGGFC